MGFALSASGSMATLCIAKYMMSSGSFHSSVVGSIRLFHSQARWITSNTDIVAMRCSRWSNQACGNQQHVRSISSGNFSTNFAVRSPSLRPSQARRPARLWFLVTIAQSTERARPKRQVAGESPAGDTILRVWFNSRMRPCQGRDNGAIPFTRSISVGSVAHQQSARVTCERQRGQHSPFPPIFRSRSHSRSAPDF